MLNIAEFSERSFKVSHIFRSHQSDHFGKVSLKKEIILRNLLFFNVVSFDTSTDQLSSPHPAGYLVKVVKANYNTL